MKTHNFLFVAVLAVIFASKNKNRETGPLTLSNQNTNVIGNVFNVKHKYVSDTVLVLISRLNDNRCRIDSFEGFYIPKNLKDSHLVLDTMLDDSTKMYLKKGGESQFGLGFYLRNNWGLWSGGRLNCYFEYHGIKYPDYISGIILETYFMRLNNQVINEDSIIKQTIVALEDANEWIR